MYLPFLYNTISILESPGSHLVYAVSRFPIFFWPKHWLPATSNKGEKIIKVIVTFLTE